MNVKFKLAALIFGFSLAISGVAEAYPSCSILKNICETGEQWACSDYMAYCWDGTGRPPY
ncbi:MAG: hypothetical protein JKY74_01645 [Shewanella sp.]|nr:hypothetical protein [Shewanella sp.]